MWGTICSAGFDARAATVFCRQLGFSAGQPVHPGYFAPADSFTQIWAADLACNGSESRCVRRVSQASRCLVTLPVVCACLQRYFSTVPSRWWCGACVVARGELPAVLLQPRAVAPTRTRTRFGTTPSTL